MELLQRPVVLLLAVELLSLAVQIVVARAAVERGAAAHAERDTCAQLGGLRLDALLQLEELVLLGGDLLSAGWRVVGSTGATARRTGLLFEVSELRLQFENELAAFAAHQVAHGRRLPGELGHDRADVGAQLGGRDDAVAIEVGLPFEALQERPGENGMAVGAVVGHLLFGAARGEDLARGPARDLFEVRCGPSRIRPAPRVIARPL